MASTARRRIKASMEVFDPRHTLELATKQSYTDNVFLFVPNLIGYTRVLLAAMALHYMSYHPKYCTVLYCISSLLDAVDGQAARALGQASKFGAVLDMVTDRCATACLLTYLASAYPNKALLFQFIIALDFASHYMHMYSSLVTGSKSHKLVTSDVSRILWWYYNDSRVLFLMCAGNEAFFVALYLAKWLQTPTVASVPFFGDLTWAGVAALCCAPISFVKNAINVVQLWKASKMLVGVDIAERQAAREKALAGQAGVAVREKDESE
ncbi:CDP-diacylglycerol-inositol 3-phosphatidyltransferase [Vararia minispora EC-137]|uniref:CDP-diacylglycerol-inositol 3-phosphatidyltransferase n=1 Tax=Vararia minispora EC-137 TaxID=1314806 RepID=A0ACB8QA32_9AGAM|nr:CDP-diacylglycerol-inositol 3-phosphatidyltransferase [Vararia minispora EC-137]